MIEKRKIKHIALVGTGTIGGSFCAHFLARGYQVTATDPAPDGEARLRAFVARIWPQLRAVGATTRDAPPPFAFAGDVAACVKDADFVQENAPETEALKIKVLAEIDAAFPKERVIASSTSALVMTRLAAECRHPERCILAHPFNPPHLVPLMELAGGERTDPAALDLAHGFYLEAGLKPVRLKREIYGHIANRLQYVVWNEAVQMVLQGYCTAADVDAAITEGPGRRWAFIGPFLSYMLAGGEGGLKRTFEMFGPRDTMATDRAARIRLTPEQQKILIDQVETMLNGRTPADMARARDARLVELAKIKNAFERT
jgi:3-hydroxyacyl-CoA dehydrogenase